MTEPPNKLPPHVTLEERAAARDALTKARTPPGTIQAGGIDDEGRAWMRIRRPFAFFRSLLKP